MTARNPVGVKQPFVRHLLLIEGITRVGKFLLANIVAGLEDIEPPNYDGLFENVPYLQRHKLIDRKAAQQILQTEMDLAAYETLIGRRLNHRRSDKSTVYNLPDWKRFVARSNADDVEELVARYYKSKSYSLFILHEVMPNIGFFSSCFPRMKMLALQRSPLDLAFSWYQRGHGKRWGNDPRLFQVPFSSKHGPIPWFAYEWGYEYYGMNEMDRVVRSMITLNRFSRQSYRKLSPGEKRNILLLRYEDLLSDPQHEIGRISKFTGKRPLPAMRGILKREKIPQTVDPRSFERKRAEVKRLADPALYRELLRLEELYQSGKIYS